MVKFTALNNLLTLKSKTYGVSTLTGLDKMVKEASKEAHQITFDVISKEAEKLARMVKEEIMAQPPAWPALQDNYVAWKKRVGLNEKMLLATEAYYNAIAVQEIRNEIGQFTSGASISKASEFSIRVGLPFKKHPGLSEEGDEDSGGSSLRYDELASILEYGTEHIQPRPHWGPTYRRWKSQHARSVKARITSLLVRRMKKIFKNLSVTEKNAKEVK